MRGFASIGLDRAKDPANLGGVLRAAGCYDASLVVLGGGRMGRYATDTMRAYKHVPCVEVDNVLDAIPYGATPVVVELCERAKPIQRFVHPESAYYIFGPEDGSVSKHIVERAPAVIYIPTRACMNLAATVNVVLYDRLLKASK
jgi:tRNA(Leu) C34 or U34 (ribose-2'-O)-methylase TrmL